MNNYPSSFSITKLLGATLSYRTRDKLLEPFLKEVQLLKYWYDRMHTDLVTPTKQVEDLRSENEFLLRTLNQDTNNY